MAVHLVRHASAGRRQNWDPDDSGRRLDPAGREQATALATMLAGMPIVEVLSSPAVRCVETVEPIASARGLGVTRSQGLFEGAGIDDAWAVLAAAAGVEGDAVLCSHGDVIPDLIRRLQLRGMEVPGKSGCSKGSCWTLEGWNGEYFTLGTYLPTTAH